MNITMIGAGYVGLVSGACLADAGHRVTCVDLDEGKIAALRGGRVPIYEPGLAELIAANVAAGRLHFSTDLAEGARDAAAIFIAVGTPSRKGDGHADLTYVYQAARDIAKAVARPLVIVTKSTVPVGTGDEIERIFREDAPGVDIAIVSNPEFLREGAAIDDFMRPDRIIIGADTPRGRDVMGEIYAPIAANGAPIVFTSRRTAELTKYAANAFLATKITFINEIADLCEAVGADVGDVSRGIGLDRRIGSSFLNAGPGYGGSCFPKDTLALLKTADDHGSPIRIVEALVAVNETRKRAMGRKIVQALGDDARGKTVGLLGLTFKPNTDDMRDAPSLAIVQSLLDAGVTVRAHDPEGMAEARKLMPDIDYCDSALAVADGAHAVAVVTEWDAYRAIDLAALGARMIERRLIDLRNIYDAAAARRLGFAYSGVGRESGAA